MTKKPPSSSFQQYIRRQRVGRSGCNVSVYDFCLDARSDPEFPNPKSKRHLVAWLHSQHACSEAIQAAEYVWNNFRAYQRRKRKSEHTF